MATHREYIVDDERLEKILSFKKEGWIDSPMIAKSSTYMVEDIDNFKLHEYVFINPPHDDKTFDDLLESIAINEQIDPIKVWEKRGSKFVIDGRHRLQALKMLGAKYIKYTTIPSNTSKEDIKTIVIESETGRNMSPAQEGIRAWRDYYANSKATGLGMRDYAKIYHTSATTISRCNKITEAKGLGEGTLNELFTTKKVLIGGSYYKSLNQLINLIDDMKPKKKTNIKAPESVLKILPMVNILKDNDDEVGLVYLKKTISNMIVELNSD